MLNSNKITQNEFKKIDCFWVEQYKPVFVSKYVFYPLDNKKNER